MGSGNEEGADSAWQGKQGAVGFNRSCVSKMGHGLCSLEEDVHLKLQGEHKQQAGNPPEEQGWDAALSTASPQPQPAILQMWVQEHPSVTASLECNPGPCVSPRWLCCCKLAHSSHIQWNMMVSVKFILLPLTGWSVLPANLTASTIINYCFHYAVTLAVPHFLLQRPLKSTVFKIGRTKPGKFKVIPLFKSVSYQKYCTSVIGTQRESHLMWEFFFPKLAGCLLPSYSQEFKAIIHVICSLWLWVHCWAQRGHQSNSIACRNTQAWRCLWRVIPLFPLQQVLMLLVPRAEVLCDDSVWRGCQAGCQWEHSAAAPSCSPEGRAGSVPSPHHAETPSREGHLPRKENKTFPWALHWAKRQLKSWFCPGCAWGTWPFLPSPHLHSRNSHCK